MGLDLHALADAANDLHRIADALEAIAEFVTQHEGSGPAVPLDSEGSRHATAGS